MSRITPVVEELFELIRGRFPTVVMGNASAETTIDPTEARFFNFDFTVDEENHGNVTISILDERTVKLIFSRNITQDLSYAHKQAWFDFIGEVRRFTSENLLGFEARDITKPSVDKQDIDYLKKSDSNFSYDEIDVTESFDVTKYGTSKSSYHKLESAKIIVRHTKRVNEESVGSRSRNISALFVETRDGERFKLPHKNMPAARAVAYRINSGGTWNDSVCTAINHVAEQAHTLTEFLKRTRRLQTESESTQRVLKMAKSKRNKYKKLLDSLATKRGWQNFVAEHEAAASDADTPDLFAQVKQIMKEYEENIMASAGKIKQVLESEQWTGVEVSVPAAGMFESSQAMVEYILRTAAASVQGDNAPAIREFAATVTENYAALDSDTKRAAVEVCKRVIEACKNRKKKTDEDNSRSIDSELISEFAESMSESIGAPQLDLDATEEWEDELIDPSTDEEYNNIDESPRRNSLKSLKARGETYSVYNPDTFEIVYSSISRQRAMTLAAQKNLSFASAEWVHDQYHARRQDGVDEARGDSLGRTINKAVAWDKNFSTPSSVVARVRSMSTDELQALNSASPGGNGSPRGLQLKAIAQELRRRGIETTQEDTGTDSEVAELEARAQAMRSSNPEKAAQLQRMADNLKYGDDELEEDTFMHEESAESDTFVHVQLELTSNRTHTGGAASFADEFGVEHASSYTKNGRVVHVFVGDAHVAGLMNNEPGVVSAELSSSIESVVPPVVEAPMDPLSDAGIPKIW